MRKRFFYLLPFLTLLFTTTVFGSELSPQQINAEHFSVLTLLPPLVALILAFTTKNVVLSLASGGIAGAYLLATANAEGIIDILVTGFISFCQFAVSSLADPWNAGIVMQVLAIGGVIYLIERSGGAIAIAEAISKKAKTKTGAQITTWILGLCVFFDDYANALIVGPIMRPIFDKLSISRAKLAFIVDATAAPIAGIALISTWVGYEVGLIQDSYAMQGVVVDGFDIFLQTIPYRFYNILMLVFVVIISLTSKDFGPMYEAEKRAKENKDTTASKSTSESVNKLTENLPDVDGKIYNALVPILTLVIGAFVSFYYSGYNSIMAGDDAELIELVSNSLFSLKGVQQCFSNADASVALFQAALFAGIVTIVLVVIQKMYTVKEAVNIWTTGMGKLFDTTIILVLAWTLTAIIKELGAGYYLSAQISSYLPGFLLPSLIFIFASIISFATGTSYGTMGILMPLAVPLALGAEPNNATLALVCTSSVLTGAIFGDHCSPISDTTILSAIGSDCDHIEHVNTQMPYALFVGGLTIVAAYIPAGLGVSPFIIIPINIAIMFLIVQIIGKKA